jgi:hypothetical protein
MDYVQRAVIPPAPVLLPDGRPGREVVGQGSPGAAVLGLVEDRVPEFSQRVPRTPALRSGHRRAHDLPLRVCQICWVWLPAHGAKLPDCNDFVHSFLDPVNGSEEVTAGCFAVATPEAFRCESGPPGGSTTDGRLRAPRARRAPLPAGAPGWRGATADSTAPCTALPGA